MWDSGMTKNVLYFRRLLFLWTTFLNKNVTVKRYLTNLILLDILSFSLFLTPNCIEAFLNWSIDILNLPPIWNSFSLEIFWNMDYKCKFIIILTLFRVFKVDCLTLTLFWVPNLSSVAQIEWKKHPYLFFLLSVQK